MSHTISEAVAPDAPQILAIYNDVLVESDAIYSEKPESLSYIEGWMRDRNSAGYPIFVAKDSKGAIMGYASFGQFRAREGYRFTVEHTVHVHKACRGQGVGEKLMGHLIARAREDGFHVMIGAVNAGNEGSLRFHDRLGFSRSSVLSQVGFKSGAWLGVVFVQIMLDDEACS